MRCFSIPRTKSRGAIVLCELENVWELLANSGIDFSELRDGFYGDVELPEEKNAAEALRDNNNFFLFGEARLLRAIVGDGRWCAKP